MRERHKLHTLLPKRLCTNTFKEIKYNGCR